MGEILAKCGQPFHYLKELVSELRESRRYDRPLGCESSWYAGIGWGMGFFWAKDFGILTAKKCFFNY